MEKAVEIAIAKKRRAKLLAEFKPLKEQGWTQRKFAAKHGITPERMGKLLKKAIQDVSL